MRPTDLRHRGRHDVRGVWFPGTTDASQLRALEAWRPGASVWSVGGGLWVRWPQAVSVRVEELSGLAVVEERPGRWSTGPFDEVRGAGLVLGWHGAVERHQDAVPASLDAVLPVPPPRVRSRGLGAPPGPVGKVVERSIEEVLGVRTERATQASLKEALVRRASEQAAQGARPRGRLARWLGGGSSEASGAARPGWLARWFGGGRSEPSGAARPGWFARWFGGGRSTPFREGASSTTVPAASTQRESTGSPGTSSWLGRLLSWLLPSSSARAAAQDGTQATLPPPASAPEPEGVEPVPLWERLLQTLGLMEWWNRLAQHRIPEELQGLQDLLNDDVDAFLRRALPLGRGESKGPLRAFTGLVDREVTFDLPKAAGGGSGQLIGEAWDYLEELYQRALQQLKREGRHREVAYVLAVLLDRPEEGLAWLEDHGLFEEAADLARSKGMAPAVVVRCLLRAGRTAEAVRWARIHDALGDAVQHLETQDLELGRRLRRVWAQHLHDAGRIPQAVAALWPVPQARDQALRWVAEHVETSGRFPPTLLARWLMWRPGNLGMAEPHLDALLTREGPLGAMDRSALITTLHPLTAEEEPGPPSWPGVARRVLRACLADPGQGRGHLEAIEALAGFVPLLNVDLAPSPSQQLKPLSERRGRLRIDVAPDDVGTTPVLDAVPLEGGRVLLALGELGVELWEAGRCLRRWDVPAEKLVPSDSGHVVLAGVARGRVTSWCRLHTWTGAVDRLGPLAAPLVADSFDGVGWWVVEEDRLTLIDAQADGYESLWSVPMAGVWALQREGQRLGVLVRVDDELHEHFVYDRLTLRRRTDVRLGTGARLLHAGPDAVVAVVEDTLVRLPGGMRSAPGMSEAMEQLVSSPPYRWTQDRVEGGYRELLVASYPVVEEVRRGVPGSARIAGELLATWDGLGRVRVLELRHGEVVLELRR